MTWTGSTKTHGTCIHMPSGLPRFLWKQTFKLPPPLLHLCCHLFFAAHLLHSLFRSRLLDRKAVVSLHIWVTVLTRFAMHGAKSARPTASRSKVPSVDGKPAIPAEAWRSHSGSGGAWAQGLKRDPRHPPQNQARPCWGRHPLHCKS